MVHTYLDSRPDPAVYEFLRQDFASLERQHGGVIATTFRCFPSFPQRYRIRLEDQPTHPRAAHVLPLQGQTRHHRFTQADLELRQFTTRSAKPVPGTRLPRLTIRGVHPPQAASLAADRIHL
jgi:hypothetical protein